LHTGDLACEGNGSPAELRVWPIRAWMPSGAHASCGTSFREKLIDVSRRFSKSALSLQVRAGRRDSIALGIENRHPISVVALVVKCKFVSVIAMCAGCHAKQSVSFFASPANR
jgi:hypothetical protein